MQRWDVVGYRNINGEYREMVYNTSAETDIEAIEKAENEFINFSAMCVFKEGERQKGVSILPKK